MYITLTNANETHKGNKVAIRISEIISVYTTTVTKEAYERLWNKINGKKYPWETNPYVWAITFKKID